MFEHGFLAVVDGGALGNGLATPKAYGSYHQATFGRPLGCGNAPGTGAWSFAGCVLQVAQNCETHPWRNLQVSDLTVRVGKDKLKGEG